MFSEFTKHVWQYIWGATRMHVASRWELSAYSKQAEANTEEDGDDAALRTGRSMALSELWRELSAQYTEAVQKSARAPRSKECGFESGPF